jgi:hypothetical protein
MEKGMAKNLCSFSTHRMQLKLAERRKPEEEYKALRSEESSSKLWVGFQERQNNKG